MNKEYIENVALLRFQIISPILNSLDDEGKALRVFFDEASSRKYKRNDGKEVKASARSIERWYYAYKKGGFEALKPKGRSDCGAPRKLDDELKETITHLKVAYPRLPATTIRQRLISSGQITENDVSLSTITRYINQIKATEKITNNKDMRRYERKHINEVWCADSSVGPYITVDGKKQKTYIMALIDDASRMIVGIDIFFNDNFINLMSVMKSAMNAFGKPKVLNLDNGTPYKNRQMTLLAARIGFSLNYCAPYTPQSKSKIERWFRTMKDHWMAALNMKDFNSLDELRSSLKQYVIQYNNTVHMSLNGNTPNERFFEESQLIHRINEEELNQGFLLELERKVSTDNVIMINNEEYEVPYRYSRQKITLRYSADLSTVYVIDKGTNELVPIELLNKHVNAVVKREKVKLTGGAE